MKKDKYDPIWCLDSLFSVVNMKLELSYMFTTQTCKMKSCPAFEQIQTDVCGKPEASIWGR